ncbi:HAMP domain-containing protein [Halomonas sp. MCCC 1A17488]|uniref:HAMP domain-containing protein n=1 Tax=Billgrantia sulfidoxydans TaxID=2733484 RepID=A0ABX7W492_9GAMM|nr:MULTISPECIES: methyl-accepting chemotaxis protein [Halomonas]MCE8015704.1 HAMP domain-containing protein [Halomonas sp. MCCC 1A17488]MCG3239037.1 HAMP domain-containing protein [Halomonas sp. MCCC 1A17488]QPP51013.1 Tar ligand binding domain-containing protein [Halomonas sp. SS10-MC5]QTP54525.1 HAMP domain-containing protein [Halomonas sulfidoxydans]
MQRFQDMTVRLSWSLVLVAFSVLIAGAGGLGLVSNHLSRDAFGTLNRLNVEQAGALNRTYTSLLQARLDMDRAAELMRAPAFELPGPVLERAGGSLAGAERAFRAFLDMPVAEQRGADVEALVERYRSLVDNNMKLQMLLLEEGDDAGYRSGQSRVHDSGQAFVEAADAFLAGSTARGEALTRRFERLANGMTWAILAALLLAVVLIAGVIWGVTINVIRPLRRIVEHFQRIARGDLSAPVEARGRNEIGQLYAELATMQRSLIGTVGLLSSASDSVHLGSREMASHNQALAARTRQQAVALEQTAASLEQLTATVASNADNARQVGESAEAATQRAREGEGVITRFVATMDEIHGHSDEIASIVGVIESIAFQTNILALNASVEAARAGDQGRGFAVVASEVRALASRSAEAARDIQQRIQASRASVAEGNVLSLRAAEHTRGIMAAIERVDRLMEQVVHASAEQRLGIEEVNRAMGQMEASTRDSSLLVEQAAAGAGELEVQSLRMQEQAQRFVLPAAQPAHGMTGSWGPPAVGSRQKPEDTETPVQRPIETLLEPA